MATSTIADHLAHAADAAQQRNIKTVEQIYSYFMTGDIQGILEILSDKVEWWHAGDPALVKYAGPFKGKDGVLQFFLTLGTLVEFREFGVYNYRAYNDKVVCNGKVKCVAKPTGRAYSVLPVYTWTIDANGKISRCEIDGDMTEAEAAFQTIT